MRTTRFLTFLILLTPLAATVCAQGSGKKSIIQQANDLPSHQYPVAGTALQLFDDPKALSALANQLKNNTLHTLGKYDFADKAEEIKLYYYLTDSYLLEGNYDQALHYMQKSLEAETKPAAKLTASLTYLAAIRALKESGGKIDDTMKKRYVTYLTEAVSGLPWNVVQDKIKRTKGFAEVVNRGLMAGYIETDIEPAIKKNKALGDALAGTLLFYKNTENTFVPLSSQTVQVLSHYISTHQVAKADIWKERNFDLTGTKGLTPVTIGIWDTGVDTDLFKGKLFTNPKEKQDGLDNDRNGFTDDVHGIAYNENYTKSPSMPYPLTGAQRQVLPGLQANQKGMIDVEANVDSQEAKQLKQKLSTLKPAESKAFWESSALYGQYIHGTHVAGIAADGNPAARLLVVRFTNDIKIPERALTKEIFGKEAAVNQEIVDYLKARKVRVVNMSWGGSVSEWIEPNLEANGIGKTPEERRQLAIEMFGIFKKGLTDAIKSAPDILFVAAAGNSNNDAVFNQAIPSSLQFPNLLAVGAVDQAGDETGFTTYGSHVKVHSNGFMVESLVPGGAKMALSGTSMSAPQVANLAAKLLAIDPALKPAEVIALIEQGADKNSSGRTNLINPKKSIEILRARLNK